MDKKMIASLMAIGVIFTLVAGYLAQPSEQNVYEYGLLDDIQGNIRPGLHFGTMTEIDGVQDSKHYTVLSVNEGIVKLSLVAGESASMTEYRGLNSFDARLRVSVFDYTDSTQIPSGINVKKLSTEDRTVYTIDGKYTYSKSGRDMVCTFDGLEVTVNGYSVVESYSGKMCLRYMSDGIVTTSLAMDFSHKDGRTYCSYDTMQYAEKTATVDIMVANVFVTFDESDYDGADIVKSEGTLNGFDVEIYTINGKTFYSTFEDYKVFTYHGHTVRMEGTQDGTYGVLDLEIWTD